MSFYIILPSVVSFFFNFPSFGARFVGARVSPACACFSLSASKAIVSRLFSTFNGLLISHKSVFTKYNFVKVSSRLVEVEIYSRENVARVTGSDRATVPPAKYFSTEKLFFLIIIIKLESS